MSEYLTSNAISLVKKWVPVQIYTHTHTHHLRIDMVQLLWLRWSRFLSLLYVFVFYPCLFLLTTWTCAMYFGSNRLCFKRRGVTMPSPYLQNVKFWLLYANNWHPTWRTASGNSWKTIKTKHCQVKMKTEAYRCWFVYVSSVCVCSTRYLCVPTFVPCGFLVCS